MPRNFSALSSHTQTAQLVAIEVVHELMDDLGTGGELIQDEVAQVIGIAHHHVQQKVTGPTHVVQRDDLSEIDAIPGDVRIV